MINIGIVGSRTFTDYELFKNIIYNITKDLQEKTCIIHHSTIIIVSGGAKGTDSLAKRFAIENKIHYKEYLPDWNTHGKKAGWLRNKEIISVSDILIAFWDGKSKGTEYSINLALGKHVPIYLYNFLDNKLIYPYNNKK